MSIEIGQLIVRTSIQGAATQAERDERLYERLREELERECRRLVESRLDQRKGR